MFDDIYVLQVSKMRELLHARGDQVVSFSPMTPGLLVRLTNVGLLSRWMQAL